MSEVEPQVKESTEDSTERNSFLTSVGSLPVAQTAVERAYALYKWAKAQNEYVKIGLERGETLTKGAAAAISGSTIGQSVATRLHPLDSAAGNKVEELKEKYPVISQNHEVIFQETWKQLTKLIPGRDYAKVAKETQQLLTAQLQAKFDEAKVKTAELRKTTQEQTHALMEYSKSLNLEQATNDINKAFEASQAFISATLAGAQQTAKSTFENGVHNIKISQVLAPLQQHLDNLKTQLDGIVSSVMDSLTPQQLAAIHSLRAKVEETAKAWVPVKDHLLAYFKAQEEESSEKEKVFTAAETVTPQNPAAQ